MSRQRIFTPAQDAEMRSRHIGGEPLRSIAASFGTHAESVRDAIKRAEAFSESAEFAGEGGGQLAAAVPDEFEESQLEALERIRERINHPKTSGAALSMLVKAQNDTIRIIRQHRQAVAPKSEEVTDAGAERVIARLERLAERKASAEVAAVVAPSAPAANGTEG